MQFYLDTDELNLLTNLMLEQNAQQYNELLKKVLDCDLRFDCVELEQTADLLVAKERSLKDEIARHPNSPRKAELQQQLALLDHVLERVNEACVMF